MTAAIVMMWFSASTKLEVAARSMVARAEAGACASTALIWPLVTAAATASVRPAAGGGGERGFDRPLGARRRAGVGAPGGGGAGQRTADAVGDLVGEDGAEGGDAGGDADLPEGGVHPGGHPGPLRAHHADRRTGER